MNLFVCLFHCFTVDINAEGDKGGVEQMIVSISISEDAGAKGDNE
jgi:hypothetical protein